MTLTLVVALCPAWAVPARAEDVTVDAPVASGEDSTASEVNLYRLYNRYTGEHLYTSDPVERVDLARAGWGDEGRAWVAPATSQTPVYRLYNPWSGDHHYTTSASEYDQLASIGWRQEGVAWYGTGADAGVPLYRLFNPYSSVGTHHYTSSVEERVRMVSDGWRYEGVAWYGVDAGPAAPATVADGWAESGGARFYGRDGEWLTGWQTIDGKRYRFDRRGRLETGLVDVDDKGSVYDLGADGALATGWRDHDGYRYYFDPATGAMRHDGWLTDGGTTYYLDPTSGALRTGWLNVGGETYFLDRATGTLRRDGWFSDGGSTYFLDPTTGAVQRGWRTDASGNTYYFDPATGAMATGLRVVDGTAYLFGDDGSLDRTPGLAGMIFRAQAYASSTSWLIMVDNTNNYLGIFSGSSGSWNLVSYWQCTTGAPATPTVLGEYTVYGKGYSFNGALTLPAYTCYYYTQFYGDYLIHSVEYYQNTFDVLDGRLGQNLSHGCVRLPIDQAKWIYDNIPYGTKLVSYR